MADLSLFYTTDENGDSVELSRPDTKGWDDVKQCLVHNNGCNPTAVEKFIRLALLGDQWDWFEKYKGWLADCERINELNDNRIPDEQTGELPPAYPLPVEPPQPQPDDKVTELKNLKLEQVSLWADHCLRKLTRGYPGHEVITWDKQEHEAVQLGQDSQSATPFLDQISTSRGLDKTELARRVMGKSTAFTDYGGHAIGQRQAYEDAVEAATTVEELIAVVVGE